jgi:threonine dehydrogenase-like Zn-dependent dehydrogenase
MAPVFLGVCGTDAAILRGTRPRGPSVLGHEVIARITEVGAGVDDLLPGDLVTVNPNLPSHAQGGGPDQFGETRDGAFAEYVKLDDRMLSQQRVLRVPSSLDPFCAVLAEPLACVVRAHSLLSLDLGNARVAIIGAGIFATLHALLASERGARQVVLFARSTERLESLRHRNLRPSMCAEPLPSDARTAPQIADELTGGDRFDVVIVAVSAGGVEMLPIALALGREASVVHLWGGFRRGDHLSLDRSKALDLHAIRTASGDDDEPRPTTVLWAGRPMRLIGSRGARPRDFEQAFALLSAGVVEPGHVVSHVISFDRLPEYLAALASGTRNSRGEFITKVLVDMALESADLEFVRYVGSSRA